MTEETVPGREAWTARSSAQEGLRAPRDLSAVTTSADFASRTAEDRARLYVQDVDRYRQLRDAAGTSPAGAERS
jgi:hypothetical protein